MKTKIVNLINQLIKYRANDLLMDIESEHATDKTEHHITELIIELTRYFLDARYCSKPNCPCSPESGIKHHYEPIKGYLQKTRHALHPIPWWVIEEILDETDPQSE